MKKIKTTTKYLIEEILDVSDEDLSTYDEATIEYYAITKKKMETIKVKLKYFDVTYLSNNQGEVFSNIQEDIYAFKIIVL